MSDKRIRKELIDSGGTQDTGAARFYNELWRRAQIKQAGALNWLTFFIGILAICNLVIAFVH